MSPSAANSTTSAPRQWGAAKRATTCRADHRLLWSFQHQGKPLEQYICGQGGKLAKLSCMDIKKMLDRWQALNKEGTLTEEEIKSLVREWHDKRSEEELSTLMVAMEMKAIEKKLTRYNVEQLGEIPIEREDGTMRVLVCRMGGCTSMETREIKIASTEQLICKYDINACAFMELNFNWLKVNSLANLASWFQEEERELRSVTTHNKTEFDKVFGKHQPEGTGLVCRHEFLQYTKTPSID
jgi:hypothetical protein